jgi:predicted nucleic acid-binding protein
LILFCDTSALMKLLVDEAQSDQMRQVSQPLVETAGRFADVFALRGYDSVQLAAANELHVNAERPVTFAFNDRRLNQAAQLLQLEVLP